MSQKCPVCDTIFDEIYEVLTDRDMKPFTALDIKSGLLAYGAYSVPKKLLCHAGQYVHIRFQDGEERLIQMRII